MIRPTLHPPTDVASTAEDGRGRAEHRGVQVWQWDDAMCAISSAPVGASTTTPRWVCNVGVADDYDRVDLDVHAEEIAKALALPGAGITLFTAAPVEKMTGHCIDDVRVDATVGASKATWAADPGGGWSPWKAGTINIVVQVGRALDPAASVNAVITATEAKTQALLERGVPGTGTATDSVTVVWPRDAPVERFAGPRSRVGAAIALATHAAVRANLGGTA